MQQQAFTFRVTIVAIFVTAASSFSFHSWHRALVPRISPVATTRLHPTLSMTMTTSSRDSIDWSFINDVFLITTNAKGERLMRTMDELSKVGLATERVNVRVFRADDEDRVRGCYTSHISVLEEIEKISRSQSRRIFAAAASSGGAKKEYTALILEDNLETTTRFSSNPTSIMNSVSQYIKESRPGDWDVFHLGYMMYVPGLSVKRIDDEALPSIVQLFSNPGTSVGTSAYIISKNGVATILDYHRKNGYQNDAIPNIMALLFPQSRYAPYPMMFHRAAKVGSLVNPQLDDFRKIMFSPIIYTTWERLMVSTGWSTNKLFPSVLVSLVTSSLSILASALLNSSSSTSYSTSYSSSSAASIFTLTFPLIVALWGASLFRSGRGFSSTQKL